jgi:transcriptional regulator
MATKLIGTILKQAVEKIDRVRDTAGIILKELLLSHNPVIINVPHKEKLVELIQNGYVVSCAYDLAINFVFLVLILT